MKRFFKKLLLLAVLLAVSLGLLNTLALKAGKVFKDGASIICEHKRNMVRDGKVIHQEGKINLWFMGSSRILAGIDPLLFDRLSEGKTYSYNLALPALPIGPYYFLLEDYLKKNPPPDYILMELNVNRGNSFSLFDHYANQGVSGWHEIASYFKHVPDKGVVVNYLFPIRMYKYYIFPYITTSLSHPNRLHKLNKKNRGILDDMMENRGYYYIKEQALFPNSRLPVGFDVNEGPVIQKGGVYDPFEDPYVKKFLDLAREKNITVVLIQTPFRIRQFLQYEDVPYQFEVLMDEYENVVIAPQGWRTKFYENWYFSDLVHVNPDGAERYTQEIHEEFMALHP